MKSLKTAHPASVVAASGALRTGMRGIGAALLGALGFGGEALAADAVGDFYKGKRVTIVVGTAAGGGYDLLARTIAKHMFVHIPGRPEVVVRNMPGAGGLIAMNYLASEAAKDGTIIVAVPGNAPLEPLFGTKRAKYDALRMHWIGTPSVESGVMTVWGTHPAKTFEEARRMKLKAGVSGFNSAPALYARLLNELLGMKLEVVLGYRGQSGAFVAMQNGKIDTYGVTYWSTLTSARKKWLRDKKIRVLLQYGPQKEAALQNVPYLPDLLKSPADRAFLEAAWAPLKLGRPFGVDGAVPAPRVAALRKAFMDTLADPKFRKDVKRIGLVINKPRNGEQLQKEINDIYRMPRDILVRLRKIANPPS